MESFDSPSLSPAKLLMRLKELRALQKAVQNKMQRRRLPVCPSSAGLPSDLHELLSQMAVDSASYETFQRLLHDSVSSQDLALSDVSCSRIRSDDLIDGVSVLNLSQETECMIDTPSTGRTEASSRCGSHQPQKTLLENSNLNQKTSQTKSILKKNIELDEMPILSPKTDFETLLIEKIKMEKNNEKLAAKPLSVPKRIANKPFLRRGEGLSRFGIKKGDLIIQNTKSLPWKKKSLNGSQPSNSMGKSASFGTNTSKLETDSVSSKIKFLNTEHTEKFDPENMVENRNTNLTNVPKAKPLSSENFSTGPNIDKPQTSTLPIKANKTWAAILTQEQDSFLRQLKQSSYYRNYESPARSVASDASCDEALHHLRHERETAEQNMFELLESKVSHASFCSESSFIHKFFGNKQDNSGDSTPMILQRCLANNPKLLQLFPAPQPKQRETDDRREHCEEQTVDESCDSECVECDRESCSSTSSCCTCRTVEENNTSVQTSTPQVKDNGQKIEQQSDKIKNKTEKVVFDRTVTETNDIMKTNLEEMNAKLAATSELLKERLHELENEIEMFRRENASLAKMREEIDIEKQRFFDERAAYEQKFNEEKILSEYYLAEEKEKLAKQKQMYDRYVREMRGRLSRKEKDEVTKLKTEIEELKEEYRIKDAKSTTCIARLRNQLKLLEKEKKDFQDECEKQKKENRRIQQVNTTTRRLSNIKYLSDINRKLAMMANNDKIAVSVDEDTKYRSEEVSNQKRTAKRFPNVNRPLMVRAKSVPNLTVTSRYAKYFSQRDAVSQMERDRAAGGDYEDAVSVISGDNDSSDLDYNVVRNFDKLSIASKNGDIRRSNIDEDDHGNCEELTNLERIYLEKFKNNHKSNDQTNQCEDSRSALSNKSSISGVRSTMVDRTSPTCSNFRSKSPGSIHKVSTYASNQSFNRSNSPIPPLNLSRSGSSHTLNRSKSPISILSNRSSNCSRKSSVIHEHHSPSSREGSPVFQRKNEDGFSGTSATRTNLNPTEFKRPDGARELRYPNGNVKVISADGKTSKFTYYNGDIKETFYDEGRIKYFYAETNTYHTTHPDGLEVLQFPDGQVEKRYADGSIEIHLPNGSIRYTDPRSTHVSEEWRFPDGAVLTVARDGEQIVRFPNGQLEVHAKDHKRREFPDGTVKLVYTDGTSETRYASGRVRVKDRQGTLIMDSAPSR